MSRPTKGARLVWRKESRKADGSLRSRAGWWIEDRGKRISTGFGAGQDAEAERKLAAYLAQKHSPARERGRDPSQVLIADVISVYDEDVVDAHATPKETAARLDVILQYFGTKTLSEITSSLCRKFVKDSKTVPAARRQLEDLRAAINHYHSERYVTSVPKIVLPEKSPSRFRVLTRSEAARLIWAAWSMKQTWHGVPSGRRTGQHVARFILVGLYTGTRSGAICNAATKPTIGRGFVDYERGVFFRKPEEAVETKKRRPPVRIPDRLLTHMRRWATTETRIKTENRGKSNTQYRMISEDYVVEWNGGPVKSIRKAFKHACKIAGLGWYETRIANGKAEQIFVTDVTPHTLRHTAATWAMQNGASLSDAADFLGMTEQVLRDNYYHAHPDFQAEVAAQITAKAPIERTRSNVVRLR